MNNTNQDTVLRAMEDARRILGEYIAPGPHDATRTQCTGWKPEGMDESSTASHQGRRRAPQQRL
jgi:hypothetical protein